MSSSSTHMRIVVDEPGARFVLDESDSTLPPLSRIPLLGRLLAWLKAEAPAALAERVLRVHRIAAGPDGLDLELTANGHRLSQRTLVAPAAWGVLRLQAEAEGDGELEMNVDVLTDAKDGFADLRFSMRVAEVDDRAEAEDMAFRLARALGLTRYRAHEAGGAWDVELRPEPKRGYRAVGADLLEVPELSAPANYRAPDADLSESAESGEPLEPFEPKAMSKLAALGRSFVIDKWDPDGVTELLREQRQKRTWKSMGATLGARVVMSLFTLVSVSLVAYVAYLCATFVVIIGSGLLSSAGLPHPLALVDWIAWGVAGLVAALKVWRFWSEELLEPTVVLRRVLIDRKQRCVRIQLHGEDPREVGFAKANAVSLAIGSVSARISLLLPRGEELLFERVVDQGEMNELEEAIRSMAESMAAGMKLPLQG